MSAPVSAAPNSTLRLLSLDQFRGYTVAGMFLVNFLGSFEVCPRVLRHTHDYISYADTIMPQFLFAVGFSLRLSFGRRMQSQGTTAAYLRMVRRLLGLILVSLVVYQVGRPAETWEQLTQLGVWGTIRDPLKRTWFQTLMHIAVTLLWLLPVVHAGWTLRVAWMLGSALLHVVVSWGFYFEWVNTSPNGIDGGPLGFLTWAIPATTGTIACDIFLQPRERLRILSLSVCGTFLAAVMLMGVGYLISCGTRLYDVPADVVMRRQQDPQAPVPGWIEPGWIEPAATPVSGQVVPRNQNLAVHPVWPSAEQRDARLRNSSLASFLAEPPFVPPPGPELRKWNYWMMSQRGGTLAYLTFSAGFSLLVFLVFFVGCDILGWRLGVLQTFGTNALLAYVLHDLVGGAVKPFVPRDAPAWYVLGALAVFFLVTWVFVRHVEKQGIYLRA